MPWHIHMGESVMRRAMLFAATFVMLACAKQPINKGGAVGAGSSRAAVEGFMTAVKSADLQAMSTIWGNEKGPGRDQFKRDELEKRLIIMQCLLQHDRYTFLDDTPQLQTGRRQAWPIQITKRRVTAKTRLTTVLGPNGRWFLSDADLTPLRDLCANS